MLLRVKTPREEFDAAEDKGYVYGEIRRTKILPTYIELGEETSYIQSNQDDPNTKYRIFRKCNVYLSETEEQLDRQEYIYKNINVTVIIYC
ncbi:hypothetical protein [Aphanothece sacrum]|uniref:Ornithine carbamoyltransferase n=1 Tax=Aphanothece sacrum FPU1 TaxID=1920663 RepID=A0A401IJE4_APHSA|nr:hypothetical protein [Aphanothece sacrum]GBF81231.1 ornithine carbamoyltransferase [Aphanothece sacrum FPU1]GBF83419.1 ornithine carbamoyltransferase [Aphanothece sacrum FPU3]